MFKEMNTINPLNENGKWIGGGEGGTARVTATSHFNGSTDYAQIWNLVESSVIWNL
jgi:hypothetical protein